MKSLVVLACGVGLGVYASRKFEAVKSELTPQKLAQRGLSNAGKFATASFEKIVSKDVDGGNRSQPVPVSASSDVSGSLPEFEKTGVRTMRFASKAWSEVPFNMSQVKSPHRRTAPVPGFKATGFPGAKNLNNPSTYRKG